MKKNHRLNIAIAIFIFLMGVTTAKAQLNFGIKVGINESTQSDLGNLYDNQNLRPGISIGGSVLYQFSENVGTQLELNYVQKGRKMNVNHSKNSSNMNTNCDYITIPMIVRGSSLLNENRTRFYFETGPYYGYMTNSKNTTDDKHLDEKKLYNNDFGLVFGSGIIQPIQNSNIIIGIRYEMGLLKVYKEDNEIRNKSLSFSVGYQF
jgi:hypothetical protein